MKRTQAENKRPPAECMASEACVSGLPGVKKRFYIRPIPFAVCVLLLVLLIGFAFQAMGYNMWRLFVSWDEETMVMRIEAQGNIAGLSHEGDFEPAFDDAFFRKLEEMEITPLLPSWMPDGFALKRVDSKIETEYYRWAMGSYTCGDRELMINIIKDTSISPGGSLNIEKDERKPDIIEREGMKFYIVDNLGFSSVFWVDLPYTINIGGPVTRDELKQMINSMFDRKPKPEMPSERACSFYTLTAFP